MKSKNIKAGCSQPNILKMSNGPTTVNKRGDKQISKSPLQRDRDKSNPKFNSSKNIINQIPVTSKGIFLGNVNLKTNLAVFSAESANMLIIEKSKGNCQDSNIKQPKNKEVFKTNKANKEGCSYQKQIGGLSTINLENSKQSAAAGQSTNYNSTSNLKTTRDSFYSKSKKDNLETLEAFKTIENNVVKHKETKETKEFSSPKPVTHLSKSKLKQSSYLEIAKSKMNLRSAGLFDPKTPSCSNVSKTILHPEIRTLIDFKSPQTTKQTDNRKSKNKMNSSKSEIKLDSGRIDTLIRSTTTSFFESCIPEKKALVNAKQFKLDGDKSMSHKNILKRRMIDQKLTNKTKLVNLFQKIDDMPLDQYLISSSLQPEPPELQTCNTTSNLRDAYDMSTIEQRADDQKFVYIKATLRKKNETQKSNFTRRAVITPEVKLPQTNEAAADEFDESLFDEVMKELVDEAEEKPNPSPFATYKVYETCDKIHKDLNLNVLEPIEESVNNELIEGLRESNQNSNCGFLFQSFNQLNNFIVVKEKQTVEVNSSLLQRNEFELENISLNDFD